MPHQKTHNQNISIYQSSDGEISFNVNVFEETVWLTQKQMAELFGIESHTITYHLREIFKTKELEKNPTTRKIRVVQMEGDRQVLRDVDHYNLDVIISVGYRVNSVRATQFRKWATQILKQYLMNGYTINEVRIKAIEDKIDNLSTELRTEFKTEIQEIHKALLKIAGRPITINNQIHLTSNKLENKIIELIDQLIKEAKPKSKLKNELEGVKKDIQKSPKDAKTKNRLTKFFNKLGDKNSDLHQTIQGIGIAKKVIEQLVKLGEKLKDLIL